MHSGGPRFLFAGKTFLFSSFLVPRTHEKVSPTLSQLVSLTALTVEAAIGQPTRSGLRCAFMTISRDQLDKQFLGCSRGSVSGEEATPSSCLVPPFDEPIYTVNEAARILRQSPNQARSIFRNEPGVHDLSVVSPQSRFLRKKSQLRIPHAVLARFWRRTELCGEQRVQSLRSRKSGQRAA